MARGGLNVRPDYYSRCCAAAVQPLLRAQAQHEAHNCALSCCCAVVVFIPSSVDTSHDNYLQRRRSYVLTTVGSLHALFCTFVLHPPKVLASRCDVHSMMQHTPLFRLIRSPTSGPYHFRCICTLQCTGVVAQAAGCVACTTV
jgi:hypothetical protein